MSLSLLMVCVLNELFQLFSLSVSHCSWHRSQSGTVRTNCLDCLDRTNSVQAFFGLEVGETVPDTQVLQMILWQLGCKSSVTFPVKDELE